MVICVRGRECGFPRLRVTWRERDSLACSRLRPGLPTSSPPSPTKRKGRGAGPRKRPRRPGLRVLEKEKKKKKKKNRSPEDETGGSVRRHREAESPARRAARGEGAAVRSRPHPQRRRPVQRASWAHRAPAPPCGRVLAGCGAASPGGAGLPIFHSEPGCPLLPLFVCVCVVCVCVCVCVRARALVFFFFLFLFSFFNLFYFGLPINLLRSSIEDEISQ